VSKFIVVDIETSALPTEKLAEIKPVFEPASNLKDPEKIKANLADKEAAWASDHALKAERGQILVIGLGHGDSFYEFLEGTEKAMLQVAWGQMLAMVQASGFIVGHNLWGFDLPYMLRRSWAVGVEVPHIFRRELGRRYMPDWCHDCMLVWSWGRPDERISLDMLAWALGFGRKLEGMTGADFAKVYAEDREKALLYLRRDLELTEKIYLRQTGQEAQ